MTTFPKENAVAIEWEVVEPPSKRNMDETNAPLGGILKINLVNVTTERMHVPGGWVLRTLAHTHSRNHESVVSTSMVFLPDPNHEWKLS